MRLPLVVIAGLVFALGCSENPEDGSPSSRVCDPGETQVCAGLGPCEGVQSCRENGSGWGACVCSNEGDLGASGASGNSGSASSGSSAASGGSVSTDSSSGGGATAGGATAGGATAGAATAGSATAGSATAGSATAGGATAGGAEAAASCEGLGTNAAGEILIAATSETNYQNDSSLSFDVTSVAPNSELHFDWSALDADLLRHPLDPLANIDMLSLVVWDLSVAELEQRMSDDALAQADTRMFATLQTENELTKASLFDFTSFGAPIPQATLLAYVDPSTYRPEQTTYTILAGEGAQIGRGVRMLKAFVVHPTSTNTNVVISSSSAVFTPSVRIANRPRTRVPVGTPDINTNWANLTLNAFGTAVYPSAISEVVVARYSQTPAELESQFFDLEELAEDSWSVEVDNATNVSLASLVSESGQAFPGISGADTWVLALWNPDGSTTTPQSPVYLTVLEPCSL